MAYSTCNATMLRCKLQQFVARITSPNKHSITERPISSKMDKPWLTLRVYSSKTRHRIYLKFSVIVRAMIFRSKPLTIVSLQTLLTKIRFLNQIFDFCWVLFLFCSVDSSRGWILANTILFLLTPKKLEWISNLFQWIDFFVAFNLESYILALNFSG